MNVSAKKYNIDAEPARISFWMQAISYHATKQANTHKTQ